MNRHALRLLQCLAALVLLAACGWGVFVALPDRVDNRPFRTAKAETAVDRATVEAARLRARNDATTSGIQLLAALAVLGGGFLTWRTIRLTRQGQLTDRFTAAVGHLGDKSLPVRIGAIYALGRIARDSRADQSAVVALLAEHLRANTPWPLPEPDEPAGSILGPVLLPHPEVRAASTVLRERTASEMKHSALNLSGIDLRAAPLAHVSLPGCRFDGSNLTGAVLSGADLRGASFDGTTLTNALLDDAKLDSPERVSA